MSAAVFQSLNLTQPTESADLREPARSLRQVETWTPENFAKAQIQGLVRQVFLANAARPARQIVFSAIDPETDVSSICTQVGEAMALETSGTVAIVGGNPDLRQEWEAQPGRAEAWAVDPGMPLRRIATRTRDNLWLVPGAVNDQERGSTASLFSYLGEIRREFEYSVIAASAAGLSSETTAMAQFADGIILVLSARRTRRATALRTKAMLENAQARVLGTVLADREFPIPERIYRRL